MTRIIGLLSWWDESPTRLAACVASMGRFCDHVVALDGRYALFDDDRVRSGVAEYEAIMDAAHAAGLSLTLEGRGEPWRDEMHKRTHLFRLGMLHASEFEDWLFVLDADESVAEAPSREGVRDALDAARADGCDVLPATLWERTDPEANEQRAAASRRFPIEYTYETPTPRFWRALRNLRVVGYHYNYVGENEAGDTVELWGHDSYVGERAQWSRALERLVVIENRNRLRPMARDQRREAYYTARNEVQAEPLRRLGEYDGEGVRHGAAC